MAGGRTTGGNDMSSCNKIVNWNCSVEENERQRTDLEGLGVPVSDFFDGRHVAEVVR
jgi:hypothetical protein